MEFWRKHDWKMVFFFNLFYSIHFTHHHNINWQKLKHVFIFKIDFENLDWFQCGKSSTADKKKILRFLSGVLEAYVFGK